MQKERDIGLLQVMIDAYQPGAKLLCYWNGEEDAGNKFYVGAVAPLPEGVDVTRARSATLPWETGKFGDFVGDSHEVFYYFFRPLGIANHVRVYHGRSWEEEAYHAAQSQAGQMGEEYFVDGEFPWVGGDYWLMTLARGVCGASAKAFGAGLQQLLPTLESVARAIVGAWDPKKTKLIVLHDLGSPFGEVKY